MGFAVEKIKPQELPTLHFLQDLDILPLTFLLKWRNLPKGFILVEFRIGGSHENIPLSVLLVFYSLSHGY